MSVILILIAVYLLNSQSNSLLITPETNDLEGSVYAQLIQNYRPQPTDGQSWLLSTNTQMDSPNYNMVLRIKHAFDLQSSFSKTNIKITIDGELQSGSGDPIFLFSDGNKYFSNDGIFVYPKCNVGNDLSTFPTSDVNTLFSGYSHANSRNAFSGGNDANFYKVASNNSKKKFPFILTLSADHINSLFMYTSESANNAYSCQYNDIFDYNAEYISLYLSMEWRVAESIQINSFNVEFETEEYMEITPDNNGPLNPFYIEIGAPEIATIETGTVPHYWSINNEAAQNFALKLRNSNSRSVFRRGMETTIKVGIESHATTAMGPMGMAFGVGDKYISSIFGGIYGCDDRVKGTTTVNFGGGHHKYMLWLDSSMSRITIGSCCSILDTVLILYDANGDYVSSDDDGRDSDCVDQAVLKTQISTSGYYTLKISGKHNKYGYYDAKIRCHSTKYFSGDDNYYGGGRNQIDIFGEYCEKDAECRPGYTCASGGSLAKFNKDLINPQCGGILQSGAASTLLSNISPEIDDTFSKELSGGNDWSESKPTRGWGLIWAWNNKSPPQVLTFKNYANDESKFAYSYQSSNGFRHQCEFNDLFDYDSDINLYLSMDMDRKAPAVSKIYKFHVYYTSPLMSVFCPSATRQIGTSSSDITGCGLGECDDRFSIESIEECRTECVLNPYCRSFSFAPYYGDSDYPTKVVCSLYNGDQPDGNHNNVQKICGLLEEPFGKKLCHTTHIVNIDTG
eukprot:415347_1